MEATLLSVRKEEGMEPKKLLIVDDDAVVLRTMKDGLSDTYKIFGANSGTNAMKVLSKMQIDLVLLDYEMPEMPGIEVLRAIRENPSTAAIPVMFLTGLAEIPDALKDADAQGFLKKSLPMEELRSSIGSFLSNSTTS